jgi:hypothetical protein
MRVALVSITIAVALLATARPATSQESEVAAENPAVALGFAWLCPGCGHLYSGETTKGAVIAAVSIGSFATGIGLQVASQLRLINELNDDCAWQAHRSGCVQPRADFTPFLVGSGIALAGYVYGLIDAGASARRMNARNGVGFGDIEVKPSVGSDGSVGAQFRIPLPAGR